MSSTLQHVDALLREFYQPATPNARKREIETELTAFRAQSDAWQVCLRVATNFYPNQFLWLYCTSTLDHFITRRWVCLSSTDRKLVRETLWNTYVSMSASSVSGRQRDTLARLIALMGKREFPDDHPNYMLHCIELIKTKFLLGISLLRATSEEVVSTRTDVTTERKNYFHSCISICIPDVVDLVTKYLLIAVCHINGPQSFDSIPKPLLDYNLIPTLPNDNQLSCATLGLLTCVQHLVSWIQTDLISEYFLMSIVDLAQWRPDLQDNSIAALSVLNELLYLQKPLPHVTTLMHGVNGLLEQHNAAKEQSEIYVDKFRELLRAYALKYWPKLMQEDELLDGFLKSLYCCTIAKNGAFDFTEKLEIWNPIIKGLVANGKLHRYNDIMHQLVGEIMRRIQFEFNKAELELLENYGHEDLYHNEWQQYLNQCIECIALVAESRPNAVFAQVHSHWSRPLVYLLSIEHEIDMGIRYELARRLKCQSFNEHLRDLHAVSQALVRIAPLLDANAPETGPEVNSQLQMLAETLLVILKLFASHKLASLDTDNTSFQTDLDYLYAQVLMALRNTLPILPQLISEDMLRSLLDVLGGIFPLRSTTDAEARIVYVAASKLLLCISTVIRPKCLLEIPTILNLMQAGAGFSHLSKPAIANVYISLISYLVLPWKHIEEQHQDFARRCTVLREYVSCLAQAFLALDLHLAEPKTATLTSGLLDSFTVVIKFFKDSSNATKDMLVTAFKPVITKALMIYNSLGASSNVIAVSVADFILSVLRTLQNQLGTQFVKEMIALFVAVGSREELPENSLKVGEKVLQMFQLVVEQPGKESLSMLPAILDFTIERVLPLIQPELNVADHTEVPSLVYALFNSILICKWQYFYKSYVQHNGSLSQASGDNQHPEHFSAIFNAYGRIIIGGTDPSIVRAVLQSMQSVNDRWRLYQRHQFKENLLPLFQSALVNMLLTNESPGNYELITQVLFTMGQVNPEKLRESFITASVPLNLKAIDEVCSSTDIPTFSQKLNQLIQDAICAHLSEI